MEKDIVEGVILAHYKEGVIFKDFRDINMDFWSLVNHNGPETFTYIKDGKEVDVPQTYNIVALRLYHVVEQFNSKYKGDAINIFWGQFKVVFGSLLIKDKDLDNILGEVKEAIGSDVGVDRRGEGVFSYTQLKDTKYSKSVEDVVNLARTYTSTGTPDEEINNQIIRTIEYAINTRN